jgi:hypothetical protein
MKNIKVILTVVLASATIAAKAQNTYYFYQAGWQGGGIVSGSFTGQDSNGDGQLSSFSGEISNFNIQLTGDNLVPDMSWSQGNLWGIVYDLNDGPFLGDGQTGQVEGFAVGDPNGIYNYASGYGPTGQPGGEIYNSSQSSYGDGPYLDITADPIMLSTTPITPDSYNAALGSAGFQPTATPEPSTLALSAMGGLGSLLLFRRRK